MKGLVNQGLWIAVEKFPTNLACDGFTEVVQAILATNGIDDIWDADDADLMEVHGALLALESNRQ